MIPFAVKIEGVTDEGKAHWALAVTKDELLSANAAGELVWYPLAACKFVKMVAPDAIQPVMVVEPPRSNYIAVPQLRAPPNRADRRRLDRPSGLEGLHGGS